VLQETGVLTPGEHTAQIAVDGGVNVRTLRLTLADGTPLQPTFTEGQLLKRGSSVTVRFTVPGTEEQEVHLASWINDAPRPPQGRQRYAREVEYVDRFLGEAIAELEARGLWDEALVIFTADHGEGLGNHGHFDHVVNLYDELVRVPLAIKLPRGDRRLPELQRAAEGLVRHIDLVPTVLDRLGLPPLPGAMGESLLSAADTERRLIAETHRPDAPRTLFALRDRRHKLIFDPAGDRFELYDTELDPGELSDQFFRDGDQFEAWQAELREIAAQPLTGTERTPEQMESLKALGYLDQ
jgi:arylsulfatase A-like enzyme